MNAKKAGPEIPGPAFSWFAGTNYFSYTAPREAEVTSLA